MSWQYSNPLGEALLATNSNLYSTEYKSFNPITTRYIPSKPGLLNRPKPNSLSYLDDEMDELSLELASNNLASNNNKYRANPYEKSAPYVPSYHNDVKDLGYLDPAFQGMDANPTNAKMAKAKKGNKPGGGKAFSSEYDLSKLSQQQIPQQLPDGPMKKPRTNRSRPLNGYDSADDADLTDLDTPHHRAHKRLNMNLPPNSNQTPRKIHSHPLASNRNQPDANSIANRLGGMGPSTSGPSLGGSHPAQHQKAQLNPQQQQIQQLTPNFLRGDPVIPVMTAQPYVASVDPYGAYTTAPHNGMVALGGLNTYQPYMVTSPPVQHQTENHILPDPALIKQHQQKNMQHLQQLHQQQQQQQLQLQQLQSQLSQKQQRQLHESLNSDQPQSHLEILKMRQQQERQRLMAEAEKEAANQHKQQQQLQKQMTPNSNGSNSNRGKNMVRSMLQQHQLNHKQYSETSIPSTNADPLNSNSPTPPITRRNKANANNDTNFSKDFKNGMHMNGADPQNQGSRHYLQPRKTVPEDTGPGSYLNALRDARQREARLAKDKYTTRDYKMYQKNYGFGKDFLPFEAETKTDKLEKARKREEYARMIKERNNLLLEQPTYGDPRRNKMQQELIKRDRFK